jgi:DNA-binding GntR family transcriptional regulator
MKAISRMRSLPEDVSPRIIIRELADALGTSMMPAREALRRLEAENALVVTGSGTLMVPVMSPADYEELCLIRVALESKAAAEAAARITPGELVKLEQVLVALEETASAHDLEAALRLNQEFHHLIYVAARRSLLLRLIESLWLRVGPQLSYVVRSDIYGGIAIKSDDHPHRQVLAALKAGNRRAASTAITQDIRRAEKVIVAHLLEEAKVQETTSQDENEKRRPGRPPLATTVGKRPLGRWPATRADESPRSSPRRRPR